MNGPFQSSFARTVTVTDANGSRSARAFIEPVSLKDPESPVLSPAGVADSRRWLLILEPTALQGPVELSDGERVYALLRWESAGGHIEGILARKGDAQHA